MFSDRGVLCQQLDIKGFKTKAFVVDPRQRLYQQSHEYRMNCGRLFGV